MPKLINDMETLQTYLSGVMEKAKHHAGNVDEIAVVLAGAILWKKDNDPIKVLTREGNMANVIWVKFGGDKYAFSYNHGQQTIEIKRNSTQGKVVYSFSNSSKNSEVINALDCLQKSSNN